MGVFDRVEEAAEDLDPNTAPQAKQMAEDKLGKGDMKTVQNMIGKQGGFQDEDTGPDVYDDDEEPDPSQGW